jgi:hypothetical protein
MADFGQSLNETGLATLESRGRKRPMVPCLVALVSSAPSLSFAVGLTSSQSLSFSSQVLFDGVRRAERERRLDYGLEGGQGPTGRFESEG